MQEFPCLRLEYSPPGTDYATSANFLRTCAHRRHYPLRLPHFSVDAQDVRPIWGPPRPLGTILCGALQQCDGRHTLAQVARHAGVKSAALLQQHDQETLLLWRTPCPRGRSSLPARRAGSSFRLILTTPH